MTTPTSTQVWILDTMSSEYQREGQYSDYVAKRTDANTPSGSYDIPVAGFREERDNQNVTVHNDLGPRMKNQNRC